ncbi:MAG: LytTR family transcriptional regulator [Cellvibrionaceae bacterium]|nr:LytTR family transcriptional regulator [Cellvibrionaceae bacterium]
MNFNNKSRLEHFQRFHNVYGAGMLVIFFLINATVLASSVIMENSRGGANPPFQLWDPFLWEYSSACSILILIPGIHWLLSKYPLSWLNISKSLFLFCAFALLFSILHVSLMVGMRKVGYLLQGRTYIFGSLAFEFFYELRKDVVTFSLLLIVNYGYRFIVSRLISEANLVAESEDAENEDRSSDPISTRDRLLVKKLGKEFIVKLADVEWMESSGNYVNLHIKDRIYPIRKTLSALSEEIADKGFCRIHRSHAINLDAVESITPLPGGDGEVKLKSGKTLHISRRYKDQLKQRLL